MKTYSKEDIPEIFKNDLKYKEQILKIYSFFEKINIPFKFSFYYENYFNSYLFEFEFVKYYRLLLLRFNKEDVYNFRNKSWLYLKYICERYPEVKRDLEKVGFWLFECSLCKHQNIKEPCKYGVVCYADNCRYFEKEVGEN